MSTAGGGGRSRNDPLRHVVRQRRAIRRRKGEQRANDRGLAGVNHESAERRVLAISVITLAELRDGHIYANWGAPRRARAEGIIASYLLIPLDMAIVDRCSSLRAACRHAGVSVPDNDIWIAATAITRGWPLASCDAHFDAIPDVNKLKLASA